MRNPRYAKEIKSLQDEIEELRDLLQKAEKTRDEYKNKYFQFKGIFQKQTHTFYQYQNMTEQSKGALQGIFKGESFEEFLACGVQPANIDALWEFARNVALNETLNDNRDDLEILGELILYFVHLYNGTNDSPVLSFLSPKVGEAFDTDQHIRTRDSRPAGVISEILLDGLANAYTGEVIKKAVVKID